MNFLYTEVQSLEHSTDHGRLIPSPLLIKNLLSYTMDNHYASCKQCISGFPCMQERSLPVFPICHIRCYECKSDPSLVAFLQHTKDKILDNTRAVDKLLFQEVMSAQSTHRDLVRLQFPNYRVPVSCTKESVY